MMADAKQEVSTEPHQTRVILAKPRLGGFGSSTFGASSSNKSNTSGLVLRPPQLKANSNPFLKVIEKDGEELNKENSGDPVIDKDEKNKEAQEGKETTDEVEAPKFVPLGTFNVSNRTGNTVPTPTQPTSGSSEFVFGQNLSARVVIQQNENNIEATTTDHSATNGTSELLFSSAVAATESNQEDSNANDSGPGLAAAAAEYERSRARPPPPPQNVTFTGEEGELNVLQMTCRLYAWEASSWRERGRGVLRLNDGAAGGGARLVARVAGSLRVVLNTKLWPDMVVQRAGTKSLRITAVDALKQVKVYLIMGSPADIAQLHRELVARVANSKKSSNMTEHNASHTAAERLDASAEGNEFLDKPSKMDDAQIDDNESEATKDDRLLLEEKTEEEETTENNDGDETHDSKPVKRKEAVDEETNPKRPCTETSEE